MGGLLSIKERNEGFCSSLSVIFGEGSYFFSCVCGGDVSSLPRGSKQGQVIRSEKNVTSTVLQYYLPVGYEVYMPSGMAMQNA